MDTNKISLASELTQLCQIPELITDIDAQQIEDAHFIEFKKVLDENLHLLFDLIQQHESVLFAKTTETEIFRKGFVILLCEQSADNVPYKTDQLVLQQNVSHLTGKWFQCILNDKNIFALVLQHYKTLIKVDLWKRNIGAIFGFHRFCQLYYSSASVLQMNDAFFVLATGTLLLEHYEPTYKELGIDLYSILMTFSHKSDIIAANIHHAVYATCSLNIPKIQDHRISIKLWNCLYKCLELDDSWKRTSDWHKIDDLMMELLKRIAFEGNITRSTILFHFAGKFAALPHKNRLIAREMNSFSGMDSVEPIGKIEWNELRKECETIDSFVVYKWVKKMLLLIGSQNMFYGDDFEVAFKLQAVHLTYLAWIYSIPLQLISSPMMDMLTKFIPSLLDCYRRYKTNASVCDEVRQLFVTFLEQFANNGKALSKNVELAERFETLKLITESIS